ncbi:hypothetical protein [Psychrobacillus sp. L3]
MTTIIRKNSLTDEELKVLVRFVELFSELAQDEEKAPAATGASNLTSIA